MSRVQVRVEGTVQGVGFRPHVYRLARELALDGFVLNDTHGVLLEVEGAPTTIDEFLSRLTAQAPPLARIERLARAEVEPRGTPGFSIVESNGQGVPDAPVSPDSATCADCLAELLDPADRRYRYPFINCTNCGPRFTIVVAVPYDRPATTMASFEMCARCRAEYEDPGDRRFHAQPNACAECGPTLRFGDLRGDDALRAAASALNDGQIVAVKGLGGYHLACRADDEQAVARLRGRKHREEKPFALMVGDLDAAGRLVELDQDESELLVGRERPIVIARRLPGASIADAVAPKSRDLGVMLPYSPLHHLLVDEVGGPLVMTSGNVSDEPIAYDDDDATARLTDIADAFLVHDRPIHMRTDDSVARAGLMLRRSRGHVPDSHGMPIAARRPLLGCGAELKSTFCLAKGTRAWVGHHIGDLTNWETLRSFEDGIGHFERLFAVAPELVAHDLHPDYASTRYALDRDGVETLTVQHHHAHLAAVLAEHGETSTAVGAIYDGAGHGLDGTVWGGELLVGDLGAFERAGSLHAVRLPGGDRAAREPWRMACAWLQEACGEEPELPRALHGAVAGDRWAAVAALARTDGPHAPVTSSVGRLFDAVAALCGLRAAVAYEGQAAAELEALADPCEPGAYPLATDLDARELIRAVVADVGDGVDAGLIAARFHNGLAQATARACTELAEQADTNIVVLSGGCFQNRLLLERTRSALGAVRCLVPRRLPPNDGGISYGQAAVAAWRDREA